MRATRLVVPAAVLLVVGFATPANAAITMFSGGSIVGDGANDSIVVTCQSGQLYASGVTYPELCSSLTSISVSPGDGTDTVNLDGLDLTQLPALTGIGVNTEDGAPYEADNVVGSAFGETLTGDSADTINAGAGNDMIDGANSASGGAGDDSFEAISSFASGGAGDDRFVQFTTTGGIDGGPGFDSWEIDFDQVTLGAGDVSIGFAMSDTGLVAEIPGQPVQTVPGSGLEQIFFTLLRQGTQTYNGSAFTGIQHVRGVAGPDTIAGGAGDDALFGGTGNDTVTGGAGADVLHGGDDNDTVTGGAGADVLHGGDDNDTIQARDGVVDRIDCGAGSDSVVADAVDVVVNCEIVDQPALPPAPVPPAPQVVQVPVVPVTNALAGPGKVKKGKSGTFTSGSPTPGATFQCSLDNGAWKTCASPYKIKTKKLKVGKHTLLVRAIVGGAADATPSKKTFKVRKG